MIEPSQESVTATEDSIDYPNSHYFNAAIEQAREETTEDKVELIKKVLTNIDKQGIDNFQVMESSTAACSFTTTSVSVNGLVEELTGKDKATVDPNIPDRRCS